MFLTQEKALKKIQQERLRGELKKALHRSIDALKRWPENFDLSIEAIRLCFDTFDFKQSVTLMKSTIRHHPKKRSWIIEFARETLQQHFNPLLASFIIETLLRSRNIEEIQTMLGLFSENFIDSLIKRSETRSEGSRENPGARTSQYTENELLLSLLYIAAGQSDKAVEPLGRALDNFPEDAQLFGSILIDLEHTLPENSDVQFHLGQVSTILSHQKKAETRFFQCIELDSPPLEKLLSLLESTEQPSENQQLLVGEILIRTGRESDGVTQIRNYIAETQDGWDQDSASDRIKTLFPDKIDSKMFVYDRLSNLPRQFHGNAEIIFLLCEVASGMDRIKEVVDELATLFEIDPESGTQIIPWIENNTVVRQSAPAQNLLARLYIAVEDYSHASSAALLAAEMNPGLTNSLISMIRDETDSSHSDNVVLLAAETELHAINGNSESAETLLRKLEENSAVNSEDLFRLTGKIIEKSGINLDRVISVIELGMRNNNITGTLSYAIEFFRANPDAHNELASRIEGLALDDEDNWKAISSLTALISEKEKLTKPLLMLQAKSDMNSGSVEKAIFEFDQLMMFNESLRLDLIPEYEKAAEKYAGNTTLNLALYQLHLDENQFGRAAHYLCKSLESDPGQIRDVISSFDKLVEKDPKNREIWEEMLKSSLSVGHIDLAKEILKRAISELPGEDTAKLHIYGARIFATDGKPLDSLRCLAMVLTGKDIDYMSIRKELTEIIGKDPLNPEARYLLGDTLLRMGEEDKASLEFEKCLELSPAYLEKIRTKLEKILPLSVMPWLISRLLGSISWTEKRFEDACRYFSAAQNGPVESLNALSGILEVLRKDSPDDRRLASIYARSLSMEARYEESTEILHELFTGDHGSAGMIMEILVKTLEKEPLQYHVNRLAARIVAKSGDRERLLDHVLRMIENRDMDQDELDEAVSEFLDLLGDNARFLTPYAGLRSRTGKYSDALDRYRQALKKDSSSWETILSETEAVEWPDGLFSSSLLLRADCLLEAGKADEAFAVLGKISTPDGAARTGMIDRIHRIIEAMPVSEYFTFGSRLLAESGDLDGARELTLRGCELLDGKNSIDMRIALAGIFDDSGMHDDAARIYKEILKASDDKKFILNRIEKASAGSSEKKISRGMKMIEDGTDDSGLKENLIGIALDTENFDVALDIIGSGGLPDELRVLLQARTYLYMDRPVLATAIAGMIDKPGSISRDTARDLLYIEGVACERLGDYGRAAAAFARILKTGGEYMDSRNRAEINYTKFIESQFDNKAKILVKTSDLNPHRNERILP